MTNAVELVRGGEGGEPAELFGAARATCQLNKVQARRSNPQCGTHGVPGIACGVNKEQIVPRHLRYCTIAGRE